MVARSMGGSTSCTPPLLAAVCLSFFLSFVPGLNSTSCTPPLLAAVVSRLPGLVVVLSAFCGSASWIVVLSWRHRCVRAA
eukprot:732606-Rhodomonas_salina.2